MSISPDPFVHRQQEQQLIEHVERLLDDPRLRVDTASGARPVNSLLREVARVDRGEELKRMMIDMGLHDRTLQGQMPQGQELVVTLSRKRWRIFRTVVGTLRVVCVSPTKALLSGQSPDPMTGGQLSRLLASLPKPADRAPSTLVILSTSGFAMDAHDLVERDAERTVVLAEPNDASGWTITGPMETKGLTDLFDPEQDGQKRGRVRNFIEDNKLELSGSGLAADRVAARMHLPPQLVEAELKSYARENPGMQAKLLDGRMVLFREGTTPPATVHSRNGGSDMPLLDRVKALFARKGDEEKKVAFLAERRTALSQQRDRAYEEMSSLEQQEEALKRQFREATGTITKKRVTSHLLQLRKDLERRQQLLMVLNQQINVVSTHLHNLELVRQGQVAQLPDTDEMTADAVKAEEMLAELEASSELAGTTSNSSAMGLTAEEQELYDELEREGKTANDAIAQPTGRATTPKDAAPRERITPPPVPLSARREAQRGEAEAG